MRVFTHAHVPTYFQHVFIMLSVQAATVSRAMFVSGNGVRQGKGMVGGGGITKSNPFFFKCFDPRVGALFL